MQHDIVRVVFEVEVRGSTRHQMRMLGMIDEAIGVDAVGVDHCDDDRNDAYPSCFIDYLLHRRLVWRSEGKVRGRVIVPASGDPVLSNAQKN
jgi:hypothetical protein